MLRNNTRAFSTGAAGAALALLAILLVSCSPSDPDAAVPIDDDDIGGVVTGPSGPEAGVWVIAETADLGVRFIKSVVTDDRGRYVVPDLPPARVRGVGARLRSGGQRQDDRRARPRP